MTSALNHQQLSNGNKLLSLLLIIFLFSSCGGSKKATSTHYPNGPRPEAGQHPKPKEKDVVKTPTPKKADTITRPPTHILPSNVKIPSDRPVQVALLLPFLTNEFSETAEHIKPKSEIAIQFYAGLKLAMQDASYGNVPIDFSVIDTKASYGETVNLQSNSAVMNADIIIGPYRKRNASLIAQMALKKGKVMISPFSEIKTNTLSGKGTVIQTFASLDTYMNAIIAHLLKTGGINNFVVIKRKNGADNRAVASLQDAYKSANSLEPLKVIEVDESDLGFDDLDLKEMLTLKPNTIFIIPAWKSQNYVTSIVRKIFVSRAPEESPTIIGMPQWVKFKNLDYQKLNDLHTIIPTADVIHRDAQTKAFEKRFYETYGSLPEKNAYKGFDLGNFLIQLIKTNKADSFSVPNTQGLFVDYHFTEEYNNPSDNLDNQPVIFKNDHVKMLKLVDYQLQE